MLATWSGGAQPMDDFGQTGAIFFRGPRAAESFIGSVGENDQGRIAAHQLGSQDGRVPFEHQVGLRAVDAERLIGNACVILRHPAEQPHRRGTERAQRILMRPGRCRVAINTRPEFAIGIDGFDGRAIHGKFQLAAAGLAQVMQLELLALDGQRHRFTRGLRRQADSTQAIDAVAFARHDAAGVPAARIVATAIEPAVAQKGMAGQRVSGAARAEFGLKILAHLIGPVVRRGVRIAVLQNVQRHIFRWMRELLEERHQSSGAFENADGLEVRSLMARRAALRTTGET